MNYKIQYNKEQGLMPIIESNFLLPLKSAIKNTMTADRIIIPKYSGGKIPSNN